MHASLGRLGFQLSRSVLDRFHSFFHLTVFAFPLRGFLPRNLEVALRLSRPCFCFVKIVLQRILLFLDVFEYLLQILNVLPQC